MRVLLVYPSVGQELIGYGDLGAIAEPLALEYLGAGARLDSHDVRILDLRLHRDQLDATLTTYRPQIVGVTGYSMHVLKALAICRRAKALVPECRTVAGGHHATLLPEDYFEPHVDFVVCGEGVGPFRAILSRLEHQQPVCDVPGVWSRVDGRFVSGGAPQPFAIDDIPRPDRSLTTPDRDSYFIDWMRPIALVRTSVGCPYRCSFCSLWKIMDGRYYMREIEGVVREIASLRERFVFLVDDEAFINVRRMTDLARALRAAGVRKEYFAYCRIDTLLRHREMMELWHAIGLRRLFIGIEATSDQELRDYNKRLALAQVERGLALAKEIGISVFAGFVVSPDYGEADFKRLERFIRHNKIEYPSFTVLTPIPGTAALASFDYVRELQANDRPNWDLFDLQHVVTDTRLPKEEFERHYKNLYRVFSGKYAVHRETIRLRDPAGGFVA
jgi:radical SAM superfamily enzyme YgiQ (UPF0313 family)